MALPRGPAPHCLFWGSEGGTPSLAQAAMIKRQRLEESTPIEVLSNVTDLRLIFLSTIITESGSKCHPPALPR